MQSNYKENEKTKNVQILQETDQHKLHNVQQKSVFQETKTMTNKPKTIETEKKYVEK